MRTRFARPLLGLWLAAASAACPWPLDVAWADEDPKRVLVLYATRRDAQVAIVGERELPRIIEEGLPSGLDYYSEFIDRARFAHPDYQLALRDFLRLKYRDRVFDVVVAMGDLPLEFVVQHPDLLAPGTPVVFFATETPRRRPANSTGVVAPLNLRDTVTLATTLQPDTRHVFVVSGADDHGFESVAREQLRPFESRLRVTYLSGLRTSEIKARLASLPEHSVVYYLVVDRDGAGAHFHPLEYLDLVSEASNAPVYCWVDSAIGHGIVGGSLKDQQAQARLVGALARRVLAGERADRIPVAAVDLNVTTVDWRRLRRWGIDEARVPPGAVVLYRQPSTWVRYKGYILGTLAILVAQTVLITGLLLQRARRRQAEGRVRSNQAALRTSYDRIRDLGGRLLRAQEEERSRIARELHDDISQQIALLEIDLEQLEAKSHGDAEVLAGDALDRARVIATSVHELSHRLHPAKLRLLGLTAALDGLRRELAQNGVEITLTSYGVPSALRPDLMVCVFRVVQEALQNALKYGAARHVSVELQGGDGRLSLTIADDGAGFNVATAWGKGLGLISMRERLEAVGGTFEIRSTPGAGTRIAITMPLADPEVDSVAV